MLLALLTRLPTPENPRGVEVSAPSYQRTVAYFAALPNDPDERYNTAPVTFPRIPLGEDWGEVVGIAVYDEQGTRWGYGPLNHPVRVIGAEVGGTLVTIPTASAVVSRKTP